MGMSHMNGNNRRPPNISRISYNAIHAQHDDLIKYISDSWSKVEMDRGTSSVTYYKDEAHHLKDFKAFDLKGLSDARQHQRVKPQHS